ncbi:MAG: holin [Enterococcus devriesei]|uniref:holin n=1 Tax=Enterococcus devriesei TaxID=319970 RepID=UPI003F922151
MDSVVNAIVGMGTTMSVLVLILVEVIKAPNKIPSGWIPSIACLIGIFLGVSLSFIYPNLGNWAELMLVGVVAGAVASGVYKTANKK